MSPRWSHKLKEARNKGMDWINVKVSAGKLTKDTLTRYGKRNNVLQTLKDYLYGALKQLPEMSDDDLVYYNDIKPTKGLKGKAKDIVKQSQDVQRCFMDIEGTDQEIISLKDKLLDVYARLQEQGITEFRCRIKNKKRKVLIQEELDDLEQMEKNGIF